MTEQTTPEYTKSVITDADADRKLDRLRQAIARNLRAALSNGADKDLIRQASRALGVHPTPDGQDHVVQVDVTMPLTFYVVDGEDLAAEAQRKLDALTHGPNYTKIGAKHPETMRVQYVNGDTTEWLSLEEYQARTALEELTPVEDYDTLRALAQEWFKRVVNYHANQWCRWGVEDAWADLFPSQVMPQRVSRKFTGTITYPTSATLFVFPDTNDSELVEAATRALGEVRHGATVADVVAVAPQD